MGSVYFILASGFVTAGALARLGAAAVSMPLVRKRLGGWSLGVIPATTLGGAWRGILGGCF